MEEEGEARRAKRELVKLINSFRVAWNSTAALILSFVLRSDDVSAILRLKSPRTGGRKLRCFPPSKMAGGRKEVTQFPSSLRPKW